MEFPGTPYSRRDLGAPGCLCCVICVRVHRTHRRSSHCGRHSHERTRWHLPRSTKAEDNGRCGTGGVVVRVSVALPRPALHLVAANSLMTYASSLVSLSNLAVSPARHAITESAPLNDYRYEIDAVLPFVVPGFCCPTCVLKS